MYYTNREAGKTQNPGPHLQSFWLVSLAGNIRISISNKFPDAANAAGQDHTLTPLRDNDTEIKERAIFPTLGYTLESPGEVKKQRFWSQFEVKLSLGIF